MGTCCLSTFKGEKKNSTLDFKALMTSTFTQKRSHSMIELTDQE